ncbi:amidase domain-containing protein [Alicyclobacillus ferrooxydans]|uniref:Putative amidase domain-containing protein n=1 Tax=Alicyclobacillus ferrooxydans TaxID=471514 RepID=A0A0P9CJH3_9BACL|nr:amidase domain-containing protein [Alicyclobacillus ferrooxydans]KPV45474.1 hypothetical protein AN477_00460 [Alicyclobacillus ferrooxydans]
MEACLDAIRKFFDIRNEVWLEGDPDTLRDFLSIKRNRGIEAGVTGSVECKRRSMAARKAPLLRTHTKISVRRLPAESRSDDEQNYLIRENITWVYQDGLDYSVEARIIWHRQRWRLEDGSWRLADLWESDETTLTPTRMADLVEASSAPGLAPERPAQCVEYDRFRAFRYAELWWNGWNPNFPRLRDDCTNFISQCLFAGRAPMDKRKSRAEGWWMHIGAKPDSENWSYSWSVTEAFKRFLLTTRGAKRVHSAEELKIGDVILYDWNGTGRVHHATMVTDFDNHGDPLVNAHTNPSYHRHYRYLDSAAWTPRTRYDFIRMPDSLC